ncbi:MAG TPA: GAP family protein [Streptosporangiaceae bacterium]|nr:GAP family protein [Streptosporangiaceae bacterium]
MLAQAAGLAVLAALSPPALLVVAVYLGSAQPRRIGGYYLAGAVLMSIVTGVTVFAALRSGGLARPGEHAPRYGLRLGLGVLALAMGAVITARKPKPPDPAKPNKSIVSRMIASPSPGTAFIVGLLVFAPSATFIAAVQAVATARASIELSALALVIVVVLNVALVWLPILAHLAAPGWTSRMLTSVNGWLRRHGRALLAIVAVSVGTVLTVNGLTGLLRLTTGPGSTPLASGCAGPPRSQ